MKKRIYLDNNASTVVDPRVIEVVAHDLQNNIGNPSSSHSFGQEVRNRLAKARQIIANYLGVKTNEIVFTSGGTESMNMLIRGFLAQTPGGHIITSNVEHSCVYATLKNIQDRPVTFLEPGSWGAVTAQAVRDAIQPNTSLIALMAVNNETGVKTDIQAIAAIAEEANIPFIVDGVALLGKETFTIPTGVSAMGFSGHKFHAPKGVGFAFVRARLKLQPLLSGGEQEFNRRGGTENVSGIVGLAKAVEILSAELPEASARMGRLRDHFEETLRKEIPSVKINGEGPRVVNTSNIAFPGMDGESLLTHLDLQGIAVSHGSACASGALEPSRILLNMGLPMNIARSSLRISLSKYTTEEEITILLEKLVKIVDQRG